MRIIAGALGGRIFDSPHGHHTHPMSDKMRGALFNILGDIGGLRVLDAFAGSGALSFETVSRGAKEVVAIDSDRLAQKTIAANIRTLGLARQVTLISANTRAWLGTTSDAPLFDVVLCDPPYDKPQTELIAALGERLTSDGILVLSYPGHAAPPDLAGLAQIEQHSYGDGQLVFYKRALGKRPPSVL